MKNILILCIGISLFSSCMPKFENKKLTYQNIIILSDLSSRIENKQSKDIAQIKKLIDFYIKDCVKPGEKIGDRSSIFFSSFSDKAIAEIDLDKIKSLDDKQQFINSTGKYFNNGLKFHTNDFELKVKNAYSNTRNKGLDLLSILMEKIENESIIKKNTHVANGNDTTFTNYDNHIYIFTDGYLEYFNKGENTQFYFGSAEIYRVRQFCKENNIDIQTALNKNSALGLPASYKKDNQFITLHILETHERDKDEKYQTYKNPKGLRDNEILEAVWRKWAKESGFKNLEWNKY